MGFLQSYGGYRGGDGEALSRSAGDAAMAGFRTLDDVTVAGKTVLVRVDLNVPMKDGRITDDLRISRILPTLHELSRKGARVVVLSHFGRPDGKPVPEMRSEEHTSELQSLMRISYAVFCLKKKIKIRANKSESRREQRRHKRH